MEVDGIVLTAVGEKPNNRAVAPRSPQTIDTS